MPKFLNQSCTSRTDGRNDPIDRETSVKKIKNKEEGKYSLGST